MISEIANEKSVILLQNAFPTLEKYIDHPHIIDGKPLKVIDTLKEEILDNFKYILLSYNDEGIIPIDEIKNIMSKYGKYKCYGRKNKRFKADKNRKYRKDFTIEYIHCLEKDDTIKETE